MDMFLLSNKRDGNKLSRTTGRKPSVSQAVVDSRLLGMGSVLGLFMKMQGNYMIARSASFRVTLSLVKSKESKIQGGQEANTKIILVPVL